MAKIDNLDDVLNILPQQFIEFDLDHYSPTQLNQPLAVWAYKYIACNQEVNLKPISICFLALPLGPLPR